jgi:hypothetical protein
MQFCVKNANHSWYQLIKILEVLFALVSRFMVMGLTFILVFKSFEEYVNAQANAWDHRPNAFVIGSPPMFRGTTIPGSLCLSMSQQ